jgi:hypothetical protein
LKSGYTFFRILTSKKEDEASFEEELNEEPDGCLLQKHFLFNGTIIFSIKICIHLSGYLLMLISRCNPG